MAIFYPQCWTTMRIVFDGLGSDDSKELIVPPLSPREATIGLNGYNQADTFALTFPADRLPISPELIRAVGVDIYLFQTAQLVRDPAPYLIPENRIITGIVDDSAMEYSDRGRSVHLTGADYTALLLAKPWPPGESIPIGDRDLVETVQALLDRFHRENGSRGVTLKAVWSSNRRIPVVGVVKEGITEKKTKHGAKPKVSKGRSRVTKKRLPVPTGRSYWDVIYELCLSYGFIAYVLGEEVVIHEPQSLSDEAGSRALHYAYGHNLSSLDISRKLGRHAAPQAVASFYDQKTRKFVEVRFPEKAKKKATGTGGNTVEFRRVTPPPGIADAETLKRFLSAAYHMWGRSEASLKFSTKHLRGLEGTGGALVQDFDQSADDARNNILRVRPGSGMAFGWDSVGREEFRKKTAQQRFTALQDQGFGDQIARLVADNYDKLDSLRRPFYLKALTFNWTSSEGISISGEAINYIDPRRDEQRTGLDVVSSA